MMALPRWSLDERVAALKRSRARGSLRRFQQMTPGTPKSRHRKYSKRPGNRRDRSPDGRYLPSTPRKEAAS
jgi:hypothetical protein